MTDWYERAKTHLKSAMMETDEDVMIEGLCAEIEDLRVSVIAFCAPVAVAMGKDHGLPDGHIFDVHHDILTRAGARMDDFTRIERK